MGVSGGRKVRFGGVSYSNPLVLLFSTNGETIPKEYASKKGKGARVFPSLYLLTIIVPRMHGVFWNCRRGDGRNTLKIPTPVSHPPVYSNVIVLRSSSLSFPAGS